MTRTSNLGTIVKQALFIIAVIYSYKSNGQQVISNPSVYQQTVQSSPLLFMENRGQVVDAKGNSRPDILFTATSGGTKVYLAGNSIRYQFTHTEYPKGYNPISKEHSRDIEQLEVLRKQIKVSTHCFTVQLQSANPHPQINKEGQSSYYENYYLAQCPNGITGVNGYAKVVIRNVYPQIDWVIYSRDGVMEYDFLVHPGGTPSDIKLKVQDADEVSIAPEGDLLMKTSLGEVRDKAPISYVDGQIIPSKFKQFPNGIIGFDVPQQAGKELRIDPSILWSTYYGNYGLDAFYGCAVDTSNAVYASGFTQSVSLISSNGFQNNFGGLIDAVLVKFSNNGNRLWSTYYGGNSSEESFSCAVDRSGNVYMSGWTGSSSAIAFNGFQNAFRGGATDAFLVKFNNNGNRLWATYYGGTGYEDCRSCTVDINDNVYLTMSTTSVSGVASNGFQNAYAGGYNDALIVKFNSSGSRLWASYYGGADSEAPMSSATDQSGNVYMAGSTESNTGIASGGLQNNYAGQSDAYLVKFDGAGNRLWATYYGGTDKDEGLFCAVDANSNDVYLCGRTESNNNIASGGFQNSYAGSEDMMLVKFASNGSRIWSTYYGGTGSESAISCIVDASGDLYLTGDTRSTNGIYFNGFQSSFAGYEDVLVAKFTSSGNRLWATYYGSTDAESGWACAVDGHGNLFIAGYTYSANGIIPAGCYQSRYGGAGDGLLLKICTSVCDTITISVDKDSVCSGSPVTLSITSGDLNGAAYWQWRKDNCNGAAVGTGTSITVAPTSTTTYYVRPEGGCSLPRNCASIIVHSKPKPLATFSATPASVCEGDTVTAIFTGVASLNAVYNWSVSQGQLVSGSGVGPYKIKFITSGSIGLSVDDNTCFDTAISQNIATLPKPNALFAVSKDSGCSPLSVTLTTISGNNTNNLSWNFGDGNTFSGNQVVSHVYPAGYYNATLTVTNGNCNNSSNQLIQVAQNPVANFIVNPGITTPIQLSNTTYQFTNSSLYASIYQWQFGDGRTSSIVNPSHAFQSSGTYYATLYASNNAGCTDTFTLGPLKIVADSLSSIPNAYSPNGDGVNDTWVIKELQSNPFCKVSVFNRWGQPVYTSVGYWQPWNGTYKGKPLPIGTYYYVITANQQQYSGSVTILR